MSLSLTLISLYLWPLKIIFYSFYVTLVSMGTDFMFSFAYDFQLLFICTSFCRLNYVFWRVSTFIFDLVLFFFLITRILALQNSSSMIYGILNLTLSAAVAWFYVPISKIEDNKP